LRKSLKEFDLNLKRNVVLKKKKFEKEKKKKKPYPAPLSAQPGLPAHLTLPLRPASPSLFFFSFAVADARAPPVSLSLPPFLFFFPCLAGPPP
jgi:hypothetical protein